jgi:cholesterol oxidase
MSDLKRPGLSHGAEVLVRLLEEGANKSFDCDVLIVGSGYGGAVAAARLAGSTVKGNGEKARVWLLERGREYAPGHFPSRFSELPGHVRFNTQKGGPTRGRAEGLFDLRIGGDVSALLGNGLGGGSLINAGVMEPPDEDAFASGWPGAITLANLADGYQRTLKMIGPQSLANDPSRRWAAFEAVASANGTQAKHCNIAVNLGGPMHNAAGVLMSQCTQCGDCITGCNQGAKGSLDTNYLAWAQARGVEMFCGGAVEHVLRATDGDPWSVTWHFTDPARRLPGADPRPIRARHVVLAAGSFGSTEILMRSGLQGLPVSKELGKRFSTNGDFLAAGVRHRDPVDSAADQESDPADPAARRVGPTITGLARAPKVNGQVPFVVEEFSVPGALRHVFGELTSTLNAFIAPGESRDANGPRAVTDRSIAHCSLYGAMGDDDAAGRLALLADIAKGSVEGALCTVWKDVTKVNVFEQQGDWLTEGLTPLCDGERPLVPHPLHLFELGALTVHPLGGCAMGTNFADGVVDSEGRVFRDGAQTHLGLVVLDGSIVPRALGINPALTIAALAERAILLLTDWGLNLAPETTADPAPRVIARRRELPPSSADWVIRERLHGAMAFDGTQVWAELNIEFEPIPGFGKALGLGTRVIGVRRATLRLWSAPQGGDAFLWSDKESQLLGTAELAGSVHLLELNPVQGEPPLRLMYQLSVQSLNDKAGMPIRVGGRLEGIKLFGQPQGVPDTTNPWRQLTEIEVRYDGDVGTGRLSLDFDDLADQREPLLRLLRLSSMPDALGDMGTLLLYVLRQTFQVLHQMLAKAPGTLVPHHLNERFPQDLPECNAHVEHLDAGARLTRYAPATASKLPPVLLIHGLGTSGSSFAHTCMPNNLVRHLRDQDGRDVWVLDLRSSVANEVTRHLPEAAEWTVDSVAQTDIPAAIAKVLERCKNHRQVDVVAHCMGAVMFCSAALSCPAMEGKVRSVVLSQVGPLARLSPLNRLRGYMATYLQQFLGIEEFDTSPEWVSREDDRAVWERSADTPASRMFRDLLPNSFPYPDDDTERTVHESRATGAPDFRAVRHRADAIFGQLFELKNLGDATLDHLDALFGWVKVKMLAQAMHFARHNMLTDSQGRNSWMTQDNFAQRFAFPVLMVHGRRNRVFDWRGSLESLNTLKATRGDTDAEAKPTVAGSVTTYGTGTPTQLVVIDGYGHLDCIIGKDAHTDVFPSFSTFFANAGKHKSIGSVPPAPTCEEPWIGPMLGWVRGEEMDHGRLLRVKLLLHPSPRRADTRGVALVPMAVTVNGLVPNFTRARVLYLPKENDPSPNLPCQVPADLRNGAIELALNAGLLGDRFDTFAVATLHDDAPRLSEASRADVSAMFERREWLMGSAKPQRAELAAIKNFFNGEEGVAHLRNCQFSVGKKVRAAADAGAVAAQAQPLTFAVASCQYPPGLMDEAAAGASYARMNHDAESKDGPQFALLIGDQIYVDATAGVFEPTVVSGTAVSADPADYDRAYQLNWRLPPFRRTVAHIPVLAMLDDHEVSNDWQPLAPGPSAAECTALEAYRRYQQVLNPPRSFSQHSPRSVAVFPSGVGFWVLDTRTQRQARQVSQGGPFCAVESAHIVPEQALHDLCAALKAAPSGQVKFIVSPSPILPPEAFDTAAPEERLRSDTWAGYPASTSMLLRFIRDKNIRRVVFLAGDAHLSSVCTFEFVGGANRVVSVVSSGLYTPWPFANQRPDELRLEGPVDMGQGADTCQGTITLNALSQQPGYAILSVVATNGVHTVLHVSLRTASGSDMTSDIPLA